MTTAFWNILQVSLTTSLVLLPLFAPVRRTAPPVSGAHRVCAVGDFAVRLLVPVQNAFPDAPVKVTPRTTLVEVQAAPGRQEARTYRDRQWTSRAIPPRRRLLYAAGCRRA